MALFFIPVIAALTPWRFSKSLSKISWSLFWIALVVVIGLRHNVGGDWGNYIHNYSYLEKLDFSEAWPLFLIKDPAYDFIYWLSLHYLNGIYATNLFCAVIFVTGLFKVCKELSPLPWLALTISVPFVILIVSLGYTRQAAALGFFMYALTYLINGKNISFYGLIIIGTLFHKTLFLMLIVGVIYNYKNTIRDNALVILFLALFVAVITIQADKLEFLIYHYITNTELHSYGAIVRVLINAIPAFLLIIYRDSFREHFIDTKVWIIISIFSIILIPASFYISTVADRLSIYATPLQLIVLSRFPVIIQSINIRTIFIIMVMSLYFVSMLVWLNFGIHASKWIPYDNYIFQ